VNYRFVGTCIRILIIAVSLHSYGWKSEIAYARNSTDPCFEAGLQKLFDPNPVPTVSHPSDPPPVRLISDAEWSGKESIKVHVNQEAIGFSYDGEIPWDEYLKFVRDDEKAMKKLREYTKDMNFSRSTLKERLHLSDKQLDRFVIPKSSPADKTLWNITELPPHYFALLIDRKLLSFNIDQLAKSVDDLLKRRGYQSQAFRDMGFIEIAHESFDTAPATFTETVKRIQKNFPKGSFHLHVGIPNHRFPEDHTLAIARALESRIILGLAKNNLRGELAYFDFTSLYKDQLVTDASVYQYRGVIRMGLDEYTRAHNIEIRQYSGLQDGLNLARFTANLARNHESLYTLRNFAPKQIPDKLTVSLNGALEYMGHLFRNKGDAEMTKLGNEMLRLSKEMITPDLAVRSEVRQKVQKFIIKNRILEKIEDPSLYLKMEQ
jgi:hypothetical protein